MTIKMAMLKSGEDVIADIKEVIVKEQETDSDIQKPVLYVFDKPYIVKLTDPDVLMEGEARKIALLFYPWVPMSKEKEFYVNPDWVVTLYEPQDDIKESYMSKRDGKRNDRYDGTIDGGDASESGEVYLTEESPMGDIGDTGTES
jgi:hypothetical protein